MGVCNCSMFCCMLLCVRSSIAIILMGKRELVALRFVIVVFPDHTHLLFLCYTFCYSESQYNRFDKSLF